MDPLATAETILSAMADNDSETAYWAVADLLDWKQSGGYMPRAAEAALTAYRAWCSALTALRVLEDQQR